MALAAAALPQPGNRHARPFGRPLKVGVDRPACPFNHPGKVLLDGFVRNRSGTAERPRYRCIPTVGKPHVFRPPLRTNHPLHAASVECEVCERPYKRNDGPRVGDSFEFVVREIAATLIRVGQGASYRDAAADLRARAGKTVYRRRTAGHHKGKQLAPIKGLSRELGTVANYIDAFAPLVLAPDAPAKSPPILLLDAIPYRDRIVPGQARQSKLPWPQSSMPPKARRRKPVRLRRKGRTKERGRILVAMGQDSPIDRPYPLLVRFMGAGDKEGWVEFLKGLPGPAPTWVVSDRDGAIVEAVDALWGSGATIHYFSHYHLVENATVAARQDGFPDGHPVYNELEELLADPASVWPSVWAHAQLAKNGILARWLTENQKVIGDQVAKRASNKTMPRSAGAAETYIRELKRMLKDRITFFRNAERLDLLLALITHAKRGLASDRVYSERLRAWFVAHNGGRGAADWKALRDPKGTTSIAELIRDGEARARQAKAGRVNASNKLNYRKRKAAMPPPPPPVQKAVQAPTSVAGKTVADFPHLVTQWHPTKNGVRLPDEVRAGSGEKLWWKRDKGPDHEWEAQTRSRTLRATGCPYCTHRLVAPSESLAATHPEIAKQFHPTRNKDLEPIDFTYGSEREVWWQCPKYQTHVWLARVSSRAADGMGCPSCAAISGKGGRPRGKKRDQPAEVVPMQRPGKAKAEDAS